MNRYDNATRFVGPQPGIVEPTPFGRYGTQPEPTVQGRVGVFVGHMFTAIGAVALAAGVMAGGYTLWYLFTGPSLWILGGLTVGSTFLIALGALTVWRTTLDERALRHDARAWAELQYTLTRANEQVDALRARNATLRTQADELRNELAKARAQLLDAHERAVPERFVTPKSSRDPVLADAVTLVTLRYREEDPAPVSRSYMANIMGWSESRYNMAFGIVRNAGIADRKGWLDIDLDDALAMLTPSPPAP